MWEMFKSVLEFIDQHPRIILLGAWPVFSAMLVWIIWIIAFSGVYVSLAAQGLVAISFIAYGILGILCLNQLAQSTTFFGRIGVKVGSVVDVSADLNGGDRQPVTETTTVVETTTETK